MSNPEEESNRLLLLACNDLSKTLTDRGSEYGSITKSFKKTAEAISIAIWGDVGTFSVFDTVKTQIAIKLSRLQTDPMHRDSWLDIAGYAIIAYVLCKIKQDEKKKEVKDVT